MPERDDIVVIDKADRSRLKQLTSQGWEVVRMPYADSDLTLHKVRKEKPVSAIPIEIQIPLHPEKIQQFPAIKALVGEHPRNGLTNIVVNLDPDELLRITLEGQSWQDQGSTCQFLWCLSFKNRAFDSGFWKMRITPDANVKKAMLCNLSQLTPAPERQIPIFQELDSLIKEESGKSLRQMFPTIALPITFVPWYNRGK